MRNPTTRKILRQVYAYGIIYGVWYWTGDRKSGWSLLAWILIVLSIVVGSFGWEDE